MGGHSPVDGVSARPDRSGPSGLRGLPETTEAEAEHEHDQRKERQRQVEHDDANERATAKDFRDRNTAAATQIGSDKAPIRLAGVYALAQLADEWGHTETDQRQTCIDVPCSYLRMPWPLKAPEESDLRQRTPVRDATTSVAIPVCMGANTGET